MWHAPIFDKPDIVTSDGFNQRFCGAQLSQSDPEVVCIVQSVQKVAMERVDVGKAREAVDGGRQSLGEGLGGVLDFARVEGTDSADFEARANLRGKSPLSAHN